MTSQQILTADFLDILFDNRNKAYGAYNLRKHYNSKLLTALGLSVTAVFSLLLLANSFSTSVSETAYEPDLIVTTAVLPPIDKPKVEPPKVPPQKTPQVKSQDFQTLKLVTTDPPPLTTQDELLHSLISDIKADGPEVPDIIEPTKSAETGSGKESDLPEPPKEIKPDRQPQFPGGMAAWSAFLNRNLQAPEELEPGEKRIVNIRFHVDADGTVTNFQIVQSGGAAFDNEVIRVLRKMPKWMPAIQGGRPIAISFTQPVAFVSQE
jgi:protein TonB